MTPQSFQRAMRRKRDTFIREVYAAEAEALRDAQALFIRRSSGNISTKQLRAMGHPFAKRDPQTPLNPAMINRQGGAFAADWRIFAPSLARGALRSSVVNLDPKAKFMFGTRTMVQRSIDASVAASMKQRRFLLHRRALQRAIRA